jgi:glycosyltransferase involved in cell wall biosynthesis
VSEKRQLDHADAFLVGLRSPQHAVHSGYDGVCEYVGTHLDGPVRRRTISRTKRTSLIDRWFEWVTGRRDYTLPLFLIETAAALHMVGRRGAVYHVLYGDSDYCLLGRFGRWTGNAVVATFHEAEAVLAYYGFDQRFFRNLSAAILLSEAQRPFVERFMPSNRIFVVPHGVHAQFFAPAERRTDRVCITVGGHTRDFVTLAKAIRLVWARDPGVRFVAVGTAVGNKGEPLVCDGVEFREHLTDDELLAAYRAASVAVFSFEWAVANNSMLEAMACGLPIVATDVGGVREYLGEEAGILAPPRDPDRLASATLKILDDPALAAQMGGAARRKAVSYDYRIVAERLSEVYDASLQMIDAPVARHGQEYHR